MISHRDSSCLLFNTLGYLVFKFFGSLKLAYYEGSLSIMKCILAVHIILQPTMN